MNKTSDDKIQESGGSQTELNEQEGEIVHNWGVN